MKISSGKSHMLFPGNENVSANVDNNTIISENKNKLLGIILESKLSFEDHLNKLCKKGSQNLNALTGVASYMCLDLGKRKIVMKVFITSQIRHCPSV